MRPTGLGHAVYKDVPDYSILCGERCIGRIYETAADPPICAGSRRCAHQEDEGPALMFAFKGRRAVFYSAAADCADRWCAGQETGPEDAG